MNILPNKLSLAQLFANNNEQFNVPAYQRRFSWRIPQIGAMFDDINLLKRNDGHLFGMIILHSGDYNGGFMMPEVVDGQQRLTALTMLLKSIERAFRRYKREETANEIVKMLTCKGPDKIVKHKILLGELDASDYNKIMNNLNYEEFENENLKNAIDNFDFWLKDFHEEQLEDFFHKLINVAVIIRLDVTQAQDAYKLFETINNRGLKLSATDIIKNFLLGHASKFDDEKILDQVKEIWAQIIINLDQINTDSFFRQYFCSLLKSKVTFKSLVFYFKDYYLKNVENTDMLGEYEIYNEDLIDDNTGEEQIENEDDAKVIHDRLKSNRITIIEFLNFIKNASAIYEKIHEESFEERWLNQHIINLWYIQCTPSFIFLMHFLQKDYSKRTKIVVLKMIEAFMLRRHTCGSKTNENDRIFSSLLEILDFESETEMIKEFKNKIFDYYPDNIEFEDKLPTFDFSGKVEERARYILEQLEYQKRGNTKETLVSFPEDVHLEHIIPQTIDTKKSKDSFGDWVDYLGDKALIKHKKFVGRIGNLTLLAAPLNIQASNNPFKSKRASYRSSDLKITNELAEKTDFKFYHVEQRGQDLTKIALQIWNIDFSDINQDN